MSRANILFLDSYTQSGGDSDASDEIGYGISASTAIKSELRARGFGVRDPVSYGVRGATKLEWILECYRLLSEAPLEEYQIIFFFHIFHQFPSEARRILLLRGLRGIKLVGYTHGSHWDPSDTFRNRCFPGMKELDLANLLSLDRVFVVSEYFSSILIESVRSFSTTAAIELASRLAVTGLPINAEQIDRFRPDTKPKRVRILFNHSPTQEKAPNIFFRAMATLLVCEDVDVMVTRRFREDDVGYAELHNLLAHFGERIQLGNTMSLGEYYTAIWNSHIQVSTARHESLGIATLEAMYAKNCCLLPNRLCYPEINGPGDLYSSEAELLLFLQRYIHDETARARVAERMRATALRYLPEVIVGRIAQEIMNVLV